MSVKSGVNTETEIRSIVTDADAFCNALKQAGFELIEEVQQEDIIIDDASATLFLSDRKIRIRIKKDYAELTYKDFPIPIRGVSTHREINIEIPLAFVDLYLELFSSIGFFLLYRVKKRRRVFRLREVDILLDEWPIIGAVAEIEGPGDEIKSVAESVFPELKFDNYKLCDLIRIKCERECRSFENIRNEFDAEFPRLLTAIASQIGL